MIEEEGGETGSGSDDGHAELGEDAGGSDIHQPDPMLFGYEVTAEPTTAPAVEEDGIVLDGEGLPVAGPARLFALLVRDPAAAAAEFPPMPVDESEKGYVVTEEPTAPRPVAANGAVVDRWGLPLSGPLRMLALAELERTDPEIDDSGWGDAPAGQE